MIVCELDRQLLIHRLEDMEREQREDEWRLQPRRGRRKKEAPAEVNRVKRELDRRQEAMGEVQAHLVELEIAAG